MLPAPNDCALSLSKGTSRALRQAQRAV